MITYRVEFTGTNRDWFFFGRTITANNPKEALAEARKEFKEIHGRRAISTSVVKPA